MAPLSQRLCFRWQSEKKFSPRGVAATPSCKTTVTLRPGEVSPHPGTNHFHLIIEVYWALFLLAVKYELTHPETVTSGWRVAKQLRVRCCFLARPWQ